AFSGHVKEMQIDAVEGHAILRKLIEPRLFGAPIEALAPIGDGLLHPRHIGPVGPRRAGRLIRESRPREALAPSGDRRAGDVQRIGLGRAVGCHRRIKAASTLRTRRTRRGPRSPSSRSRESRKLGPPQLKASTPEPSGSTIGAPTA